MVVASRVCRVDYQGRGEQTFKYIKLVWALMACSIQYLGAPRAPGPL